LEGTGGAYFAAAVEIEQIEETPVDNSTTTVNHHQSMKEVQLLKAESTQVFDTMRITVNNADGGTYLLVFTDADNENTKSADISTTASAGDMKNAVKNYYSRNRFLKSGINVNMTMYDVDGNVTTVAENAT
jgi:hypothetical protein